MKSKSDESFGNTKVSGFSIKPQSFINVLLDPTAMRKCIAERKYRISEAFFCGSSEELEGFLELTFVSKQNA